MAKKIHKKTAIVLIILFAGIASVVSYAVWHNAQTKPAPVTPSGISLADTPAYGACELVTTNTIKETFGGDKILTITEGVRTGQEAPNGTIAEGCTYTFSTRGTNANSFTVAVYDYEAEGDGSASELTGDNWAEVGGATPVAYFNLSSEDQGAITAYKYRILPGSKNVMLTLRQPTRSITYNRDEALDFLGGIAAKLNLTAIDKKTNDPNANTTPGAVTDNP